MSQATPLTREDLRAEMRGLREELREAVRKAVAEAVPPAVNKAVSEAVPAAVKGEFERECLPLLRDVRELMLEIRKSPHLEGVIPDDVSGQEPRPSAFLYGPGDDD